MKHLRLWPLLAFLLAACALWPPAAYGQGGVVQSGSVVVGDCVKWVANGIIADNGASCASSTTPGGSNGQVQYNNAGAFGAFTFSGDCTLTASTGVILCTKTNGTAFGAAATKGIGAGLTTSGSNIILADPSISTLGGVFRYPAVANQWINSIDTTGQPTSTQPAFTDISGTVTLAQISAIATARVLGNVSGGATQPAALTATQLTTLCNAFTSTLSGCAPLSGGGTANFLRADGTWANPNSAAGSFSSITGTADPFPITGLAAGAVTITGGASTLATGGALNLLGGASSGGGIGGAVNITGGNSTGGAVSGAVNIASGNAATAASAGAINLTVGTSNAAAGGAITLTAGSGNAGTAAGGNINLVPGAAVSTGTPGEAQINGNSALTCGTYYFTGTPAATDQVFYIATRPLRVKTMSEVHSVAAGGASTMTVMKDTGTTAPGGGTNLHQSGSFNLNGTANTVQVGSVSTTIATANMATGDRLSVHFTAAIQASAGIVVTACMAPT